MSSNPRFSLFLRAIGLKRGFRRTGPSGLVNIAVAAAVGVVSGHYIFKEPLDEYWKERLEQERLEKEAAAVATAGTTARTNETPAKK